MADTAMVVHVQASRRHKRHLRWLFDAVLGAVFGGSCEHIVMACRTALTADRSQVYDPGVSYWVRTVGNGLG